MSKISRIQAILIAIQKHFNQLEEKDKAQRKV